MNKRYLPIAAFLIAAVMLAETQANAATYTVYMRDAYFSPANATMAQGSTVRWVNRGGVVHTATQDKAVVPGWGTNSLSPGAAVSESMKYAGTFGYYCRPHGTPDGGMQGSIRVPTRATPTTGTRSTYFSIRVSTVTIPSGWVMDIQKKKGSGTYANWITGTRSASRIFRAGSSGAGYYYFRARLRRVSNGYASAYSPAARIRVS